MNKPLRIALRSVAAVCALVIALVLYVLFGDLSVHKDRVLNAASDATGFYVAVAGTFDLDVGREITLSAGDITLGNPAWPDEHPLATVATASVVVNTWSLLSGPIQVDRLEVSGAHVNLKSDVDGGANWIPAADPKAEEDSGEPAPDPLIQQVMLNDIRVSHEQSGETLFYSETATLRLASAGVNRFEFELDEKLDGASLTTSGVLQFGERMSDVTSVAIEFSETTLNLAGTSDVSAAFSGTVTADMSAEKPIINADIDVTQLDIVAGDSDAAAEVNEENVEELLFSTTPLVYSWLESLNLDASLDVASANLNGNAISNLRISTTIEDTALSIAPVEFALGDGRFQGSLSLLPATDVHTLELEANIQDLRLAQLADKDQDPASVPPINAVLNLTGTGASLHDIMASSNGKLSGRQGNGHLNLQAMGALFSDFLTSVVSTLNPLAEARTYTNVECGIFEIEITDGVASIEELALQSDRVTIVSSGNIDFTTEVLDLTLNTKSREGLGLSVGGVANSFIKLGGTLKEPSLGVDAAGSVTTTGAAVATGGLSLLAKSLWDRVSSEVDMCADPDDQTD